MHDEHKSNESALPAELAALERQLAELAPAALRLDRDQLMFAAGRASAGAGHSRPERPDYIAGPSWAGSRFWPAATALMTAATVVLAAMVVWQRGDVELAAALPSKDAAIATDAQREDSFRADWRRPDRMPRGYLGLRYVALTQGVGAIEQQLPAASGDVSRPTPPATSRQLLEELLSTAKLPSS